MYFIAKGRTQLGVCTRDAEGNVKQIQEASFTFAEDGPSVAVGAIDPETMKFQEGTQIYGDWQAAEYLGHILEQVRPIRPINIPSFETIFKTALEDGISFCDYCPSCNCRDCIVYEWKE